MIFTCPAVKDGCLAPEFGINSPWKNEIVCGIPRRSIPLEWSMVPEGSKSLAIVFEDFDNIEDEGVHWIHWLVADIPPTATGLEENSSCSRDELIQGRTGWALPYGPYEKIPYQLTIGYGGPAPERKHEYELTLFALDAVLEMKNGFFYNQFRRLAEGHILDKKTLKFYYG